MINRPRTNYSCHDHLKTSGYVRLLSPQGYQESDVLAVTHCLHETHLLHRICTGNRELHQPTKAISKSRWNNKHYVIHLKYELDISAFKPLRKLALYTVTVKVFPNLLYKLKIVSVVINSTMCWCHLNDSWNLKKIAKTFFFASIWWYEVQNDVTKNIERCCGRRKL